ncbi:MAG: polymer-forming cytoskeletal protein [Flavobacteriales bacterium]|nr:polymer-forming cytoskeletal protein [Flavobacteriales bacterium]
MARNFESAPELAINRLVEGTVMEGKIESDSNIRIDGRFTGEILTKGRLVIGPTGHVDGTVVCAESEIEGGMKGRIQVKQLLSLKSTARVDGEIFTDKLSIEPGASFTGTCSMGAKVKDMKSNDDRKERESVLEEQTA